MPRPKQSATPSFEAALEELESMVETMESGQLPLEELISNYEKGAKLIAHCETVLSDARKRLEVLTLQPSVTPPEDSESSDNNTLNHDDEIRLF